jgi:5-methyltetrahydropteroyltriglutamate--homocysteine methyltransferase
MVSIQWTIFSNTKSLFLGHIRTLPRLIKAPFQYATYAYKYLDVAKKLTKKPIKQAVITASALSLVYAPHLFKISPIENYSHEQFIQDLINECEKDIRFCLGNTISSSLFK